MHTIFALLVCEIVLQLIDKPVRHVSGWKNCGAKHPGECNSLGFRGQKIVYSPDDFVVLLVGDSEVYAPSIPFEQRPDKRLEHHLKKYKNNVKVFTVADMGYGQDQQYLALREYYEKYRADLVLLMFTMRNDVENNLFPTSGLNKTMKPTYWLENGELKGPTEGLLEPVGSRLKLALLWERYIGKTMGRQFLEKWIRDKLPTPYQPEDHYDGEVDYTWQDYWKTDPENAYKGVEYESVGPSNQFTPKSEMRKYGNELTRKLLSEIEKLVETNNGNFVIFKDERPKELLDIETEKVYFLKDKYYRVSMRQYQDNLKELLGDFEHYSIPITIENFTVRKGDSHLNAEAIDQVMRDLVSVIKLKHLHPQTPTSPVF